MVFDSGGSNEEEEEEEEEGRGGWMDGWIDGGYNWRSQYCYLRSLEANFLELKARLPLLSCPSPTSSFPKLGVRKHGNVQF